MQRKAKSHGCGQVLWAVGCAATLTIGNTVLANQVELPLVNSGFEDGPLGKAPSEWESWSVYPESGQAVPQVVYQNPYSDANKYKLALPGPGWVGLGGGSGVYQTVAMLSDADVRWSFWVGDLGGDLPENGPAQGKFTAKVSRGMHEESFVIELKQDGFTPITPAGWTCEALPGGSFWVTSRNLQEVFEAGDQVKVSYSQAWYPYNYGGGVFASVDDQRPVPEATATFGLVSFGMIGLWALRLRLGKT